MLVCSLAQHARPHARPVMSATEHGCVVMLHSVLIIFAAWMEISAHTKENTAARCFVLHHENTITIGVLSLNEKDEEVWHLQMP